MKRFTKFLGVSAIFALTAFTPLTATQSALAAPAPVASETSAVSVNDPFSYIVQPGDNLTSIANTFGTTVAAIQALNPQITDPNLIYSGEVLLIPVGQISSAIIPLTGLSAEATPVSITPGSKIQVSVNGFPSKTSILVSVHPINSTQFEVTKDAITNSNGKVTVSVKIPANLNTYYSQTWVAQVSTTNGTSLRVTSNQFIVGISTNPEVGIGPFIYIVRQGDFLSLIAREYGTSESAILAANPQITNPSLIYPGEAITIPYGVTVVPYEPIIPLTGTFAEIIPPSGPQGTNIDVVINGFPANIKVKVGLHKLNRKLIESTAYVKTDAYGHATVSMQIPVGANINNNREWLAQVSTTGGASLTVTSNPFYVTGN